MVALATHGTSKLALTGALIVFAAAWLAPRLTGRLVVLGWVIACVAVLPAALIAHRIDLHNAKWLEPSTRHRIIIWNYTAEQVLKAPWLGVGAHTTYVLGPQLEQTLKTPPDEQFRRTLSTHSHSVYLQTWFELGLVGATLLTLLGLAILQAIRALAVPLQRYAYATFASAAIMAASSYGMWQIWFIAMFGLCAALFALGAELNSKRDRARKPQRLIEAVSMGQPLRTIVASTAADSACACLYSAMAGTPSPGWPNRRPQVEATVPGSSCTCSSALLDSFCICSCSPTERSCSARQPSPCS